jgi:hypothetical protein
MQEKQELQSKLQSLKLKKALIFANIESLSEIDEAVFTQLGITEAQILQTEKKIVLLIENIIS